MVFISRHFPSFWNIAEYFRILWNNWNILELSRTFGIIENFWNYLDLLGMFRDFRIFLELLEIF